MSVVWLSKLRLSSMRQFHAIVTGRVQGVYFRAETQDVARRLGLAGFVKNRPDGAVEVVAEGDQASLNDLLEFLHRGPSLARVANVDVTWDTTVDVPQTFTVRY
jgi:acylphosphatase